MYRDSGYGSEGNYISTNNYDLRDLAKAYLDMRKLEARKSHKDFVEYAVAKYNALSKALGVEITDRTGMFCFFIGSLETTYNNLWDPFGISLEGPGDVVSQQFKARNNVVPQLVRALEDAMVNMLTDFLIMDNDGNKLVTEEVLHATGFNMKAPDPYDYF